LHGYHDNHQVSCPQVANKACFQCLMKRLCIKCPLYIYSFNQLNEIKSYQIRAMESDISNFINIRLQVIACLCYCCVIGKIVRKGLPTLFAMLPIVSLFLTLPLRLHTLHLGGIFAFFISWLANSKLLLFAFGKGPLSDSSLSLKRFVFVASLPIKIHSRKETTTTTSSRHQSILKYTTKGLIFIRLKCYFSLYIWHSFWIWFLYEKNF